MIKLNGVEIKLDKYLDYIRAHSDFVTVHVSSFME